MSIKEIVVPDIGDFDAVEVIEVLVAEGDTIQAEDSIVTVESDKASMEIPSSASGKILKLKVKLGDKIAEGSILLMLEVDDTETAEALFDETPTTSTSEKQPEAAKAEATSESTAEPSKQETATESPAAPATTSIEEILVPDIGDFDEVEVIEVLVAEGDIIEAEDSLITVESDKASMEIPSSASGKILKLKVNIGDKVSEGSVLLMMEVNSGGSTPKPAEDPAPKEDVVKLNVSAPAEAKPSKSSVDKLSPTVNLDEKRFSKAYASPSVRKFARELGVDLGEVEGTDRKGRINKDDVKGFVKKTLTTIGSGTSLGVAPMPEIDFSKFGEVDTLPLSKINKLTGEFLHRSWVTVPHVTQFDEADITEMEAFRKQMGKEMEKEGINITPLAFIIRAVVTTLKLYPRFNSSLDASGENLILKKYFNIGVAVDTPDGLVVPVIREADQKSLVEISQEIREFAQKARDKKLKPSDMQGGCFTISSLGGIGGTKFTPIVNAPEVAVLGVSKSKTEPQWNGSEFKPRLMLPLSLSYDHRVIDGADGARFTTHLSKMLSDIRRMMV